MGRDMRRPTVPRHTTRKGHGHLAYVTPVKRLALVVLSVLAGAVLAMLGIYGVSAAAMYHNINRVIGASESLVNSALGCGDDHDMSASTRELVSATRDLRDELNKPQWTFLRDHTAYGNDIDAARTLLDAMGDLVDGPFDDALQLANGMSGFSLQDKTVDLGALTDMPRIVEQARAEIADDLTMFDQVGEPKLDVTSKLLSAGRQGLTAADHLLDEYDELVNLLPKLLGTEGDRTYLAVIYNPAELRSGGGMVGNIAAVTAVDGKVTIGDFTATTNLSYAQAPFDDENVTEADVFGEWIWRYPQTTTMNPNFRRAAITLTNMWKAQQGNENVDVAGVIAIDPVFMQALIGATGTVTLKDGRTLDGTNTVNFFLNELYTAYPEYEVQNAYTNEASKTIMNHVFANLNTSSLSDVLKAIRDSSASGHFKLWMERDEELDALVQTQVLDENAEGTLPADETTPVSGVYFSELEASKLSWYLDVDIDVTKTCGPTFASGKRRLFDGLDEPTTSTELGSIDEASLGDEYTVVVTLTNTLTEEQAAQLPTFVVGEDGSGAMHLRTTLMAPYGGEITSLAYDNGLYQSNGIVDDHQFIVIDPTDGLAPGQSATIAYTVRASEAAAHALDVTTTPVITASGTYTGTGGVVRDECGADVPDAVEDELLGTTGGNGADGASGADGAGDAGSGADGGGTDGAGTNGSGADAGSGGSSGSGSGGSGGLDSLNELKNQLSCPVDLKRLLTS